MAPFRSRFALLILLALAGITGLVPGASAQKKKPTKATPTPAASPADSLSPDALGTSSPGSTYVLPDPVARVNGQPITRAELEHVAVVLRTSSGHANREMTDADRKKFYPTVLDTIVTDRLLSAASASETVPELDVEKRFGAVKADYPSEQAFEEEMKKTGQTPEHIRENLRSQLAQQQWVEHQIADNVKVAPPEVEKFYLDGPPDKFDTPEMVRASHILIAVRHDAPPEEAVAAEKTATDLADRAKKGEDFADLARQYSADPSAKKTGGDLDYFSRDRIMPEFAEAAFKLKSGEVGGPVRTQFGYHVIKVTDVKSAHHATLDEARPQITTYLEQQKRQMAVGKLVQNLRDNAKVETYLP